MFVCIFVIMLPLFVYLLYLPNSSSDTCEKIVFGSLVPVPTGNGLGGTRSGCSCILRAALSLDPAMPAGSAWPPLGGWPAGIFQIRVFQNPGFLLWCTLASLVGHSHGHCPLRRRRSPFGLIPRTTLFF